MRDHTWRWSASDETIPRALRAPGDPGATPLEALPRASDDEPVELPPSVSWRVFRALAGVVLVGGAMALAGWFVLGPQIAEALEARVPALVDAWSETPRAAPAAEPGAREAPGAGRRATAGRAGPR